MLLDKTENPTYPALLNLEWSQDQVAKDLREGFRTVEELFYWIQDLMVVSFGYVKTDTLKEAYLNRSFRKVLMTGEDFEITSDHIDASRENCREFRLLLEERLNGPFQRAYLDLRSNANEYVDPDSRVDPRTEEVPIALRPSLQQLRDEQRLALKQLMNGFESSEEILSWERRLNSATYGELSEELITGLRAPERHLRHNLLNDDDLRYSSEHKQELRYLFACKYLIPAFNAGIRTMTRAAGETADDGEESDGEYSGSIGV